jgi:hypothetical protein
MGFIALAGDCSFSAQDIIFSCWCITAYPLNFGTVAMPCGKLALLPDGTAVAYMLVSEMRRMVSAEAQTIKEER